MTTSDNTSESPGSTPLTDKEPRYKVTTPQGIEIEAVDIEHARSLELRCRSLDALVTKFGDATADLFDQMEKGHWTDDHGHDVRYNDAMLRLQGVLRDAVNLRKSQAALAQGSGGGGYE